MDRQTWLYLQLHFATFQYKCLKKSNIVFIRTQKENNISLMKQQFVVSH